jgi:DNA-binding transcriptional ArsR family regulator
MDEATFLKVLKAVANRKRLRMMQEIAAAGQLSCGQVAERFNLSQPTISHHLGILADAGVIVVREAGQHRFISINRGLIERVAEFLPTGLATPPSRSRAGPATRKAG